MRIALLGTRGIPARYGGFETFAEELATRLVERGHSVRVYCRHPHPEPSYRGVDLVYLPPVRNKYLETIAHTVSSTLHLVRHPVDVALYCNGANAIFTALPRLIGIPTALNVDGLERKRKKWNRIAKAWYWISEWLATFCASKVVTDAQQIAAYYLERYRCHSEFIPYGAPLGQVASTAVLATLQVAPDDYFLYVTRFEPENNPLAVRQAFESTAVTQRLILVGDAPYAASYIAEVRRTTDPRVLLPGAIYGPGYHELQSHCFAYIHATEVGGTHPALIEAMGRGALVLFLDTSENREVAGGVGLPFYFDREPTLRQRIEEAAAMNEAERRAWGRRAMERVREQYSWDAVTSAYERLLASLLVH